MRLKVSPITLTTALSRLSTVYKLARGYKSLPCSTSLVEFSRIGFGGSPLSEKNPSETVRKGVRVTSEASILVVSSNKIELLGLFSSAFEASGRSYQDFSDSLRGGLLGNQEGQRA